MGKVKTKTKAKAEDVDLGYQGPTDPKIASNKRFLSFLSLVSIVATDIMSAFALYIALHWSSLLPDIASDFSHPLKALSSFRTNSVDVILLCGLRIAMLAFFAKMSSSAAFTEGYCQGYEGKAPKEQGRLRAKKRVWTVRSHSSSDLQTPLLSEDCGEHEDSMDKLITKNFLDEVDDTSFADLVYSISPKDYTLLATFFSCTLFQIFIGAKCVSFDFSNEVVQGFIMGSAVVWINLESTLIGYLAHASGVYGRALGLTEKNSGLPNSAIDISSNPNGSTGTSYSDLSSLAEHRLRGDKGVRTEEVISPNDYLLRAISLARPELSLIALGFTCLALTSIAGLIIPKFQGRVLDAVITWDAAAFNRDVLVLTALSLVSGLFGGLRGLCFSIVGKRVLKTLQDRLFSALILQDIAYFDSTTSGELTSRLTNDVSAMSEPLNYQLSALVRNLASLAGGILLCFLTSWRLSMLAFTTMAPIMHVTVLYSRWSRDLNRRRYAVLAEANSVATEALSNMRTVRAFSTEGAELAKFSSKTLGAMSKGVRDAVAYSGTLAINNWLDLGASVLILWYGGVLVMRGGSLTVGQLITFQLYWNLIQSGYQAIMSVLSSLTKASGAAQRVLTLIDSLPDIDPDSGTMVPHLAGAVAMEDVHFHYQLRPDHPVLTGVSLCVPSGSVCALVGRSGGGKSTVVHLMMRFYDPSSGRVLLDGADLRSLNLRSVHRQLGLVAQDTQLWACSIEENIAYGVETYTRRQLETAARQANAHAFIAQFPEGYATRVGEKGVRLSGGQRQRIAIARMLLRRPRILFLDEATSALDTESEALVQAALDQLLAEGGRTVILVAHRLSTVKNADQICVIDGGAVVERGSHDDLLTIPNGVYGKLVQRQLSKMANEIQERGVGKELDIDTLLDTK